MHKLNSPRVMFERTVYVLHICLFLAALLLALSTLINGVVLHAISCSICLLSAYGLRQWGKRKLDFEKHERGIAINTPNPQSALGDFETSVHRVIQMFERLENEPMTPATRQALRRRIIQILQEDEKLAHYFRHRLRQRHPYMLNAF